MRATIVNGQTIARERNFAAAAAEIGDAIGALGICTCSWRDVPPSKVAMDAAAEALEHLTRQLRVIRFSGGELG